MKKLISSVLISLICAVAGVADQFTFPVIAEYPKMDLSNAIIGDSIYVSGSRDDYLYAISFSTGRLSRIEDLENAIRIYTAYNGKVIVQHKIIYEFEKGRIASYNEPKEYNPQTGEIKKSDTMDWIIPRERGTIFPHEYYQNDIFYSQDVKYREEEGGTYKSKISIYNYGNKQVTPFPLGAALWGMSPDKMHLLLAEDDKDSITVYNIQSGKGERGYGYWKVWGYFTTIGAGFINNEMFYIPRDFFKTMGSYEVHSIRDKTIRIQYDFHVKTAGGRQGVYDIVFSPDLSRALVSTDRDSTYLCDTTAFRDDLISKNLLFRPTTAVSTESRVRVRENPNLEAQTFGHLEPGDELEVTDRSGVKVKIGEMTDWWYKIKRKSDGLEGWAYGAFLKLASYQGELGPRPEKDLR